MEQIDVVEKDGTGGEQPRPPSKDAAPAERTVNRTVRPAHRRTLYCSSRQDVFGGACDPVTSCVSALQAFGTTNGVHLDFV